MASSGYYRRMKNEWYKKYTSYSEDLKEVTIIRNNVDQSSDVGSVNNKIDSCIGHMARALKGSPKFGENQETLELKKVKYMGADPNLSQAYSYLNAEVQRLSQKKDDAYDTYEYYRKMEKEAKKREAAEAAAAEG